VRVSVYVNIYTEVDELVALLNRLDVATRLKAEPSI